MSGFKQSQPGLRFANEKITPDEIDRYEVYNVVGPGTAIAWYFLGTSGTADVTALTMLNFVPDYPRNVQFNLTGSSTGNAGSLDITGKDQFGNTITETMGFGSTDNGGSAVGTKVFRQVDSGTIRYGTYAGVGTTRVGFSSAGTTTLFGLPVKLQAASDVVHIAAVGGTDSISINKGTIGTMVVAAMHAVRAPKPVTGTMSMQVWVKSTFDATAGAGVATISAGTART